MVKKFKPPPPEDKIDPRSKYRPEMCEALPGMFSEGEDVSVILVQLGISRATFYKWVKQHPAFKEAYEMAKEHSKAYCTQVGWDLVHGRVKASGTGAWIFMMKNKFQWQDRVEVDTTTDKKSIEEMISEDTSSKEAEKTYFRILKGL